MRTKAARLSSREIAENAWSTPRSTTETDGPMAIEEPGQIYGLQQTPTMGFGCAVSGGLVR